MTRVLDPSVSKLRRANEPLQSRELAARIEQQIMREQIENRRHLPSPPLSALSADNIAHLTAAGRWTTLVDPQGKNMLPARPAVPQHVAIYHKVAKDTIALTLRTPLPPPTAESGDTEELIDSGIVLAAADTVVSRDNWNLYLRAERAGPVQLRLFTKWLPKPVREAIQTRRGELERCYGLCNDAAACTDSSDAASDSDDSDDESASESSAMDDAYADDVLVPETPLPVCTANPPTPASSQAAPPVRAAKPPTPVSSQPANPPSVVATDLVVTHRTPTSSQAAEPAKPQPLHRDLLPSPEDDDEHPLPFSKRQCVADKADVPVVAPPADAPASPSFPRPPRPPRKRKAPAPPPAASHTLPPEATQAAQNVLLCLAGRGDTASVETLRKMLGPISVAAGQALVKRLQLAKKLRLAEIVRRMTDDNVRMVLHAGDGTRGGVCDLMEQPMGVGQMAVFVEFGDLLPRIAPATYEFLLGVEALLPFAGRVLCALRATAADAADGFAATPAALVAEYAARVDAVYNAGK